MVMIPSNMLLNGHGPAQATRDPLTQRSGTRMRNSKMIIKGMALPMQSGTHTPQSVGIAMILSNRVQRWHGPAKEKWNPPPQSIGTRMRNSKMILKVTALPMQSGTRTPQSVGTAMTFANMIQRIYGPAKEN